MNRGSSSVVLLGLVCVMTSACGGQSGKTRGGPVEGGKAGAPEDVNAPGGEAGDTSAGSGRGGLGGSGGTGPRGVAGTLGQGGSLTTGGRGGVSGSGPSGGRAGAPVMPVGGATSQPDPVEPPADCYSRSQRGDSSFCSFEFGCSGAVGASYSTTCEPLDDDIWSCSCADFSDFGNPRGFEVRGAEGLDACAAVAKACVAEAPDVEPTCEPREEYTDEEQCTVRKSCGPEIDLDFGRGVTVRAVEDHSATCRARPNGRYECTCSEGNFTRFNQLLTAPEIDGVCDALVSFCARDEEAQFDGPETCEDDSVAVNAEYCDLTRTCVQATEIAEGVSLLKTWPRYARCERPASGVSNCSCTNENDTFNFTATTTAANRDACIAAIGTCALDAELEPTGEIACELASQESFPSYCRASLDCKQPMTIGGKEFAGRGHLNLVCQRESAGEPWWCSCVSNGEPKLFELGDAASSSDACTEGGARCQEEIDVFIGPYPPEIPGAPDPFPMSD